MEAKIRDEGFKFAAGAAKDPPGASYSEYGVAVTNPDRLSGESPGTSDMRDGCLAGVAGGYRIRIKQRLRGRAALHEGPGALGEQNPPFSERNLAAAHANPRTNSRISKQRAVRDRDRHKTGSAG